MAPKLKFTEGEKVLCFHGPLIYEAKALKSQITKDKQVKYFIHYAGWNKNWDEWVPESRVLKYNEANVQKQNEVSRQHASLAAKNKKVVTPKPKKPDTAGTSKDGDSRASTPSKELNQSTSSSSAAATAAATTTTTTASTSRGSRNSKSQAQQPQSTTTATATITSTATAASAAATTTTTTTTVATTTTISSTASADTKDEPKRKRSRFDQSIETEEEFLARVEIKIKMPDDLKPWVVDDWHAINRLQKLIDIPAKTSVQDIVNAYIQHKKASKTTNQNKELAYTDITLSLIEYFDVMLGCQLLYKFERPQYSDILEKHPGVPMSKLYGSFHLLRLFVKLGSMLAFTTLEEKSVQLLMVNLQDFLKYLVKNSATLFSMHHYVNVTSEYLRKVQ